MPKQQTPGWVQFELKYDPHTTRLEDILTVERTIIIPDTLKKAVPKRRIEYAAARACAMRAMQHIGQPRRQVMNAEDRSPVWPAAITGSLTHTHGFAAAIVARRTDYWALGIDAEQLKDALNPNLIKYVFTEKEWRNLAATTSEDHSMLFTIGFSAKESLYKALFPHCQTFFGFHDACLVDLSNQTFKLTLNCSLPNILRREFIGTWQFRYGLVQTRLALPHP